MKGMKNTPKNEALLGQGLGLGSAQQRKQETRAWKENSEK